ncbi:MAG: hypothetical protein LBV04_08315, partial [Deferribacteraceae bacterium]|nr:hypothetical protein [Deferribacteraceae bacterium]
MKYDYSDIKFIGDLAYYEGEPVTGIVHYIRDGQLRKEMTYKDGQKNGIEKIYGDEDAHVYETLYSNG